MVLSTQSGPLHSWNTCPEADIRSVTNEARLPRSHMGRKRSSGDMQYKHVADRTVFLKLSLRKRTQWHDLDA
jgi:hypothetical protein